ncbi:MAG TPA: hypothetical protein VK607_06695, partial [Kofleriaceae bacterium]|nr:hypothetical protein [Kofleriaceae bacterium]
AGAMRDLPAGVPTARMAAMPDPAASAAGATRDLPAGVPTARLTAMPDPVASAAGAIDDPAPGAAVARIAVTRAPAARAEATSAGHAAAPGAARTPVPTAGPNTPTLVPDGGLTAPVAAEAAELDDEPLPRTASDGTPEKPRARSVSGEIRVPVRRAPSIKPPLGEEMDDDEEPLIMIEMREEDDDVTGPRPLPVRRRPIVKSDPPELYARAGEVDLKEGDDRAIDADEPRIVVDEDAFAPPTGRIEVRAGRSGSEPLITTIDVVDDADTGALIHDRVVDRDAASTALDGFREDDDDSDTGEIDVVMLDAPKKPRPERRTQIGIGPTSSAARQADDPDASGPTLVDPHGAAAAAVADEVIGDATSVDLQPAPPGEDTTSDQLAAPPAPSSDADTNPHVIAAPPRPAPPRSPSPPGPRSGAILRAVLVEDDDEDDEDDDGAPRGPHTSEMTAAELDDAIPERRTEFGPELLRRRLDHDAVDDGWGPPGTTIPPPLLGAIPGSEDDDGTANAIPMPNVDSSPLLVGPAIPIAGDRAGRALARALEHATARAIDVIRELEHTQTRDEIVQVMIAHLAETHHRAGFFVTKHAVAKDAGELGLFTMSPRPAAMPSATLRLDRPSTLQDVVGTRLPYRGPMHDDASRAFLISVLGACPAEILLVPVTVRERVVGVLFGEHRLRHTFDDQLALAARAAGMALERILRSRRG